MPSREQSLPVLAPDMGLVTGHPNHAVSDRAWVKGDNFRCHNGHAMKIPGFVEVQAAALDSQVMGIYDFNKADGFQAWVVVTRTKVFKKEANDAAFVDVTGASPLTGNIDEWADFTVFRDTLLITNGRDPIKKWTGVGNIANLGGSPPTAKRISVFQNHIMLAWIDPFGTPQPQRLQWSDLGLHETWTGGESGSKDFNDEASGILDIVQLRDSLIVYKDDAIHTADYTGASGFPFAFRRMSTTAGPISARMVAEMHDVHFFASNDRKFYRLTLAGPEPEGHQIVHEFFDMLNWGLKRRAFAFVDDANHEINFVIPMAGDTVPSMSYMMNHVSGAWQRRELAATAATARSARQLQDITWDGSSGTWDAQTTTWDDTRSLVGAYIVLHGDINGKVFKHSSGETGANGVPIAFKIYSKMYDFGAPAKKKRLQRLHIHYEVAGSTLLKVYVVTANAPESVGVSSSGIEILLDGSGDQWIDFDLTAQFFQFVFENAALNQPAAISGYVPVWYERETT